MLQWADHINHCSLLIITFFSFTFDDSLQWIFFLVLFCFNHLLLLMCVFWFDFNSIISCFIYHSREFCFCRFELFCLFNNIFALFFVLFTSIAYIWNLIFVYFLIRFSCLLFLYDREQQKITLNSFCSSPFSIHHVVCTTLIKIFFCEDLKDWNCCFMYTENV